MPFAIFPLIYSPGPDKLYDIQSDLAVGSGPPMHYATLTNNLPSSTGPNDPYVQDSANKMMANATTPTSAATTHCSRRSSAASAWSSSRSSSFTA